MDGKWMEGNMDERVRWMNDGHICGRLTFTVTYMKEQECCKYCIVQKNVQTWLVGSLTRV